MVTTILLVCGLVCFLLATFRVIKQIDLGWLGLAFWILTVLL